LTDAPTVEIPRDPSRPPLVTAVMIAGRTRASDNRAMVAIKCFLEQSYQPMEMVVVNCRPERRLTDGEDSTIRETPGDASAHIAELRNAGLALARGDYVIVWEEGDYHHMHRTLYQMAHRRPTTCALLRREIRYHVPKNTAVIVAGHEGLDHTLLHPATWRDRYEAEGGESHRLFWMRNWPDRVLIDNPLRSWPGPALYLRMFYGGDQEAEKRFMGTLIDDGMLGQWHLNDEQKKFLRHALRERELGVERAIRKPVTT